MLGQQEPSAEYRAAPYLKIGTGSCANCFVLMGGLGNKKLFHIPEVDPYMILISPYSHYYWVGRPPKTYTQYFDTLNPILNTIP